jgi:hypothetical protein
MKHAGKNNLKNVNSLTLGDDKPKIDTGQKVSSNHHIGASPAQVSQLSSFEQERNGPWIGQQVHAATESVPILSFISVDSSLV